MLRAYEGKEFFSEEKFQGYISYHISLVANCLVAGLCFVVTAVVMIKCLIKRLHPMCTPISELPFNTITVG